MGIGTGIGITEEHRALALSVRGWLARAAPPGEVRGLLDAGSPAAPGLRPAHWKALAAQGLTGVHLPEAYGGGGGGLLDLAVVLEEAAYASLPGPYLATALTSAVLRHAVAAGSEALGGPLRELAAGERIAAVALTPGALTATPAEGGHRLDGTAPPVLTAGAADLLLLPAATPDGEHWFLVDAGAEGLAVRPHRSVDPTRPTAEVRADAVHVPAQRVVPMADPALVGDLAAVLLAADACGTAARSLDTAVAHAAVREQFGRPIGAFQAVKHLCSDLLVRLEQARALTWDAARAADEAGAAGSGGEPARSDGKVPGARGLAAALAAATAPEAAYTCAKDAIQILGGIGFTWEHDAHLQLRRAVLTRQLLGPADTHRLRATRLAEAGARRELALELPAEAARHRAEARPHLAAARGLTPAGARRALAATGYAAPHLPAPYGLDAGPLRQLAIQQESREQGIRLSDLSIATWVVPSLHQMTFDSGLEALIARSARLDDPARARIGALAAEAHALACVQLRTTLQQVSGREPGAGASVRKLVQTLHQQKVAELTLELLGPDGAVDEPAAGERALHGFLMSRCLTIAGGTTQIQLNVVAERILGLPRD